MGCQCHRLAPSPGSGNSSNVSPYGLVIWLDFLYFTGRVYPFVVFAFPLIIIIIFFSPKTHPIEIDLIQIDFYLK